MLLLLCGLFGLLIGSFLNVVVWRVPRNESIATPGVALPPVRRPRCRRSRTSPCSPGWCSAAAAGTAGSRFRSVIRSSSWQTPGSGSAWLPVSGRPGSSRRTSRLASGLLALGLIDLDTLLLPNRVLYPTGFLVGGLLVLAAALDDQWSSLERAALAGAASFAVFFVIHLVSPRGMGFGDVRLSFVLGMALGWLSWGHAYLGLFLGFLLGAVIGSLLIALKLRGRKDHVPFGPFLVAGTLIAIYAGAPLLDLYRG